MDTTRYGPEATNELTAHQYLICSGSVYAYILEARAWNRLNVAYFSDPQFDTGMVDKLVMDDERRQMIKVQAANYVRKDNSGQAFHHQPWTADSCKQRVRVRYSFYMENRALRRHTQHNVLLITPIGLFCLSILVALV